MPRRQLHIDAAKVLASHLIVLHHFTVYGPLADALGLAAPRLTDFFFDYARMAVRVSGDRGCGQFWRTEWGGAAPGIALPALLLSSPAVREARSALQSTIPAAPGCCLRWPCGARRVGAFHCIWWWAIDFQHTCDGFPVVVIRQAQWLVTGGVGIAAAFQLASRWRQLAYFFGA
jgi:hypothetical protein